MNTVTSNDGTTIAFDRVGEGPALILVGGAFSYRASPPSVSLTEALAERFTVYAYDRRGRGDSGDTPPYAVAREVEDLAAVIEAAGGSACVYGRSSGAALALEAAASGLPIARLALYEPPYAVSGGDPRPPAEAAARLTELAAGNPGDATEYFMTRVLGLPAEAAAGARQSPMWPAMVAVERTAAYDVMVLGDWAVPTERAAAITAPTLVMAGEMSPPMLRNAARAAADAIPGAELRTLPGQTHEVDPKVLAPVLAEFFAG